jgi:membrane protease YdiL (CAAX protease family)
VEAAAMIALLLSYIWGWQGGFMGASQLVVGLYFGLGAVSHARRRESMREIGVRLDNGWPALRNAAVVVVVVTAATLAVGAALGSWHFSSWADSAQALSWLFAWGTVQQYGLVCFLYRRFVEVFQSPQVAMAAAAVSFAVFHLPNPFLVIFTLVAGGVSCALYRREPNVFALGLAHAVISFVVYGALPYEVTHGMRVGPGYLPNG